MYHKKGGGAMPDNPTFSNLLPKPDYHALIFSKRMEKDKCKILLKGLKKLRKDITTEIKEWGKSYRKSNQHEVTRDVVKKARFEGKAAEKMEKLYHGRVSYMNNQYISKISKVCEKLDAQISNIDLYIEKLDNDIAKMQREMNN